MSVKKRTADDADARCVDCLLLPDGTSVITLRWHLGLQAWPFFSCLCWNCDDELEQVEVVDDACALVAQ